MWISHVFLFSSNEIFSHQFLTMPNYLIWCYPNSFHIILNVFFHPSILILKWNIIATMSPEQQKSNLRYIWSILTRAVNMNHWRFGPIHTCASITAQQQPALVIKTTKWSDSHPAISISLFLYDQHDSHNVIYQRNIIWSHDSFLTGLCNVKYSCPEESSDHLHTQQKEREMFRIFSEI